VGLDELQWPETPEKREAWLEWLKNLEPFDMTPEELDAFEAELSTSKEIQRNCCERVGKRRIACDALHQQIDMQIAAIAVVLGNCVVVSKDIGFNDITGLAVEANELLNQDEQDNATRWIG